MSTPNTTNGAIEEFANAGFAAEMPDGSGNWPSVLQPAANEDHSEVQAEIEVLHSKNLMKRLDSTSTVLGPWNMRRTSSNTADSKPWRAPDAAFQPHVSVRRSRRVRRSLRELLPVH
jgi:hypothetical protein